MGDYNESNLIDLTAQVISRNGGIFKTEFIDNKNEYASLNNKEIYDIIGTNIEPTREHYKFGGWQDKNGNILVKLSKTTGLKSHIGNNNESLNAVYLNDIENGQLYYPIWYDLEAPEINISSTANFDNKQTITINAQDYGSGIAGYYIGKIEPTQENYNNNLFSFNASSKNSYSITIGDGDEGIWYFAVIDNDGNWKYETKEFIKVPIILNQEFVDHNNLNYNHVCIFGEVGQTISAIELTTTGYTATTYNNSNIITLQKGINIVPDWKANKYNIILDNNDGTSSNTAVEVIYNSAVGMIPDGVRTGYTFVNWNTKADGSGKIIDSNTIFKDTSDKTVYAQWKINSYKLKFNANGGTVNPSEISVEYDKTYGALPTPLKDGFNFKGWYTAATGGTKVSNITKMSSSDVTVYAQWEGKSYEFNYTGKVQSISLAAGTYSLDCYGAQGGGTNGGKGGRSTGTITLTSPTTLNVYVGGQGSKASSIGQGGGYNGGGNAYNGGYGGGGMTHISTVNTDNQKATAKISTGTTTTIVPDPLGSGTKMLGFADEVNDGRGDVNEAGHASWRTWAPDNGYAKSSDVIDKNGDAFAYTAVLYQNLTAGNKYIFIPSRYGNITSANYCTHLSSKYSKAYNESLYNSCSGEQISNKGYTYWEVINPNGKVVYSGNDYVENGTFKQRTYDKKNAHIIDCNITGQWKFIAYDWSSKTPILIDPCLYVTEYKTKTVTTTESTGVNGTSGTFNSSAALIVAGGGGGSTSANTKGGYGGSVGENAYNNTTQITNNIAMSKTMYMLNGGCGRGGTSNAGFAQGVGESVTWNCNAGGAGAGWYGGYVTNNTNGSGAGGSSYTSSKLSNISTQNGVRAGNGYAVIKRIK